MKRLYHITFFIVCLRRALTHNKKMFSNNNTATYLSREGSASKTTIFALGILTKKIRESLFVILSPFLMGWSSMFHFVKKNT